MLTLPPLDTVCLQGIPLRVLHIEIESLWNLIYVYHELKMVLLAANPLTISSFGRQTWQSYLSQQWAYTARQGHARVRQCMYVRWGWGWGLSHKAQFKCDLNKGVSLSYNNSSGFYILQMDMYVSDLSRRFVTNIIQVFPWKLQWDLMCLIIG